MNTANNVDLGALEISILVPAGWAQYCKSIAASVNEQCPALSVIVQPLAEGSTLSWHLGHFTPRTIWTADSVEGHLYESAVDALGDALADHSLRNGIGHVLDCKPCNGEGAVEVVRRSCGQEYVSADLCGACDGSGSAQANVESAAQEIVARGFAYEVPSKRRSTWLGPASTLNVLEWQYTQDLIADIHRRTGNTPALIANAIEERVAEIYEDFKGGREFLPQYELVGTDRAGYVLPGYFYAGFDFDRLGFSLGNMGGNCKAYTRNLSGEWAGSYDQVHVDSMEKPSVEAGGPYRWSLYAPGLDEPLFSRSFDTYAEIVTWLKCGGVASRSEVGA